MNKQITALTMVSTALDVLEKYKCQQFFTENIKDIKEEVDLTLMKVIREEYTLQV